MSNDENTPIEESALNETVENEAITSTQESKSDFQDDSLEYFEDDKKFFNDSSLEEKENYALFKQEEGVISWSIKNLYDSEGNQYSKRELRANPPVLFIEASNDSKAEFILTKEFAGSLSGVLDKVYYGYHGIEKKKKNKFTVKEMKQSIVNAITENPLKVGAFTLLSIVLIIGLIVA